jgi:hypothetical protein
MSSMDRRARAGMPFLDEGVDEGTSRWDDALGLEDVVEEPVA